MSSKVPKKRSRSSVQKISIFCRCGWAAVVVGIPEVVVDDEGVSMTMNVTKGIAHRYRFMHFACLPVTIHTYQKYMYA